jgi:hypothetical protein
MSAAGVPVAGSNGWSDIQIDDTAVTTVGNLHHDPFDPNYVQTNAYHLYPLIFAGVLGKVNGYDDYGIVMGNKSVTGDARDVDMTVSPAAPTVDPFSAPYATIGAVMPNGAFGGPLFNNHHMEQK